MEDKTNTQSEEDDNAVGVAQLPPLEPTDIAAEAVAVATGQPVKRKENDGKSPATKRKKVARGAPPAPPTIISFQADPSLTNQNKKDGIPPWRKIQEMLYTEESVTLAMINRGILVVPSSCPKCQQPLRFPKRGAILRCSKCYSRNGGEWSQSLYKGTFFEFGRMKRQDVLMFLYHWLCGAKHKQLCLVMGWSNSTMFRWTTLVQELVATVTFYENYNPNPKKKTPEEQAAIEAAIVKIGGQDVVVQIDDCPFEKRYCAHPDYLQGGWIFCGVEVTPKHRFFSCVVPDRTPAKFMALARKYIAPGSIIRSSRWTSNDILDIQANAQYRLEKIQASNTNNPNNITVNAPNNNNPYGQLEQPFVNPFQPPHPQQPHGLHDFAAHHHHPNLAHHPQHHPHHPQLPQQQQQQHPAIAAAMRQQLQQQQQQQQPQPPQPPQNTINNNLPEGEIWIVPEETTTAVHTPLGGAAANHVVLPTRKHNNVKELQGSLFEFIWKKQHDMNLWNGILWTLKQVKYSE